MKYWTSVGKACSLYLLSYGTAFARENENAAMMVFVGVLLFFIFDLFAKSRDSKPRTDDSEVKDGDK